MIALRQFLFSHRPTQTDTDYYFCRLGRNKGECLRRNGKVIKQGCTKTGWAELREIALSTKPNRILLAACQPYLFVGKLKKMARELLLDPALLDVVDIIEFDSNNKITSLKIIYDTVRSRALVDGLSS